MSLRPKGHLDPKMDAMKYGIKLLLFRSIRRIVDYFFYIFRTLRITTSLRITSYVTYHFVRYVSLQVWSVTV